MHIPLVSPRRRSNLPPPDLAINTNVSTSDLKPPKLEFSSSDSNISEEFSSEPASPVVPASPSRRVLSDKLKATPSSVVRNTRIYSNFDFQSPLQKSNSLHSLNSTIYSSRNVNSLNKIIAAGKDLPPELAPIVTLFTCNSLRIYNTGAFAVKIDDVSPGWLDVEAKLTGNELAIWSDDELNPKYYNLFDYSVSVDIEKSRDGAKEFYIKFSNDFNHSQYNLVVKFTDEGLFKDWLNAIYLSNYERHSLNEAFTAVVLSLMGPKLSDIHILLSNRKRFVKQEWCNIRFPQVNHKWLRVFMCITPGSSKKKGKIEMYTNDKISKKTMICSIPNLTSAYNVYPENVNMIEFNSLMKLNGDIYVNKNFEYLFYESHSNGGRNRSGSKGHSKSSSVTSVGSNGGSHRRTTSQSSFFSNVSINSPPGSPKPKSSKTPTGSNFVRTNFIYLMPIGHPGVSEIETMIRNLIPIFDAFKLYGRPEALSSDKLDTRSLLYAMPSLPHYEYLSTEDGLAVLNANLAISITEQWPFAQWVRVYKDYLHVKLQNYNYSGSGDVVRLSQSIDLQQADLDSIHSPILGFETRSPSNSIRIVTPASPMFDLNKYDSFNNIAYDTKQSPAALQAVAVDGLEDPFEFDAPIKL